MSNGIKFDRKIINIGSKIVRGCTLPPQVIEYLQLDTGSDIIIMVDKGKYGPFISIWNKDQEKQRKEDINDIVQD